MSKHFSKNKVVIWYRTESEKMQLQKHFEMLYNNIMDFCKNENPDKCEICPFSVLCESITDNYYRLKGQSH